MANKNDATYYVPSLTTPSPPCSTTITNPWISSKKLVIAGAGMAGLSLAIALNQHLPPNLPSPQITIYERDSREDRIGRDGYTLSLRTDIRSGGVQIIDRLGLYEACKSVSVTHAGAMHIWNHTFDDSLLRVSAEPVGEKGLTAMRIRRNALQKVLAEKANECGAEIVWETAVVGAERRDGGGMRVQLSNGEKVDCDLLVAADGSGSKVRSMLRPNDKLDYAGVVIMTGTGKFGSEEDVPEPMQKDWGLVVGGGGYGLFVSPVERDSALWSFSYYSKEPKEPLRHPMPEEKEAQLMAMARTIAQKFGPKVMQLVEATDRTSLMQFCAHDRSPFAHEPSSHGDVVWMGDANHAVSPFAGNGANMAIIDGWDLAQSLSHAETLEAALAEYDKSPYLEHRKH